jgi:hypothetical protein
MWLTIDFRIIGFFVALFQKKPMIEESDAANHSEILTVWLFVIVCAVALTIILVAHSEKCYILNPVSHVNVEHVPRISSDAESHWVFVFGGHVYFINYSQSMVSIQQVEPVTRDQIHLPVLFELSSQCCSEPSFTSWDHCFAIGSGNTVYVWSLVANNTWETTQTNLAHGKCRNLCLSSTHLFVETTHHIVVFNRGNALSFNQTIVITQPLFALRSFSSLHSCGFVGIALDCMIIFHLQNRVFVPTRVAFDLRNGQVDDKVSSYGKQHSLCIGSTRYTW